MGIKKSYAYFIGALLTFAAITYLYLHFFFKNSSTIIFIQNKKYTVLTAKTSAEHERGLMYVKSKKEIGADGMIFYMGRLYKYAFWNKNTYVDLDLYWMVGDKVVGKTFLPHISKTKTPLTVVAPAACDTVVEIIK